MPIPRGDESWFWRILGATQLYDALIAGAALMAGSVGTYKLFVDQWYKTALLSAIGLVAVCVFTIVRAALTYRREVKKQSLHELQGCLVTLHALLIGNDPDAEQKAKLRLTVHVPIDNHHLQQVLNYVGDQRGGKTAHRRFPMQSGIAGRVYRTRNTFHAHRVNDHYDAYIKELVTGWSYTEDDARKLNPETMSWMAVPIEGIQRIEGILYADACTRDFFAEARQNILLLGALGVARFVAERYPG